MPDRAPYAELEVQMDMWKDYATPACDRLRLIRRQEPDQDGPKPAPRPVALDSDEERAIECLAAGIA